MRTIIAVRARWTGMTVQPAIGWLLPVHAGWGGMLQRSMQVEQAWGSVGYSLGKDGDQRRVCE
jgi:hypothetical protein